jgi:Lipid A 3-O-deacylase (PagL)
MRKLHAVKLQQRFVGTIVLVVFSALFDFRQLEGAETSAVAGYALAKGTNEFGLWAGGSPDSTRIFGNTEDRKLVLFALRYGRVLAAWDWVSLEYTLDIFPAALVFEPDRVRRGSSTIYGAGLSPLGFKINFAQQSWIQPFVAASVGFLYFEDDIPVPDSSRFNFTPEFGLGVQFFLAPKRALTLGYKLHHLSNANTSRNNPGMDSHVIYLGFSFFTP